MAARMTLPEAVVLKVAAAVQTNWPELFVDRELDDVFEKRHRAGGADRRVMHLKHFAFAGALPAAVPPFNNLAALPPPPQGGLFHAGA